MGTHSATGRRQRSGQSHIPAETGSGERAETPQRPAPHPVAGLAHPAACAHAGEVLGRSAAPAPGDPLGGSAVPAEITDSLRRGRGRGDRLPEPVAAEFGSQLGHDLSAVRIHTGGGADSLARSLQAVAFTSGSDIYFRNSAYDPHGEQGQRLLAHELTHVVQNSLGSGGASAPTVGRADDPAEAEADRSADRVVTALRRQASRLQEPAAPARPVAGGSLLRRRDPYSSEATLRRARTKGDESPVTNDDLALEFFGVDKGAGEFTPSERGGKLYVGSPGQGFWGTAKLDPNAPGPVTVEGGFLQKLVVNDVKADYGEGESEINFAEDPAAPHKDPPLQDGAWTYESDKPVSKTLKPGEEGYWDDLDRPLAAFAPVEEGLALNFWSAELAFETVFVARVTDTGQPWAQVEGKWDWASWGDRKGVDRNEVNSIDNSTTKAAQAWDPEVVRALPHANGLPATWKKR
jgi:hypothetical protein